MKTFIVGLACALAMSAVPSAQTITIPERIEKLSERAKDNTNISLDGPLLKLAGMFLNANDKDQAAAKSIISKLNSIHVRTFEFERKGEYSEADLDAIRAQLKSPEWTRIVEQKERDEHTQIFVRLVKGQIGGLLIISAESRELSIVSIDGAIDPSQLSTLGGKFGIPNDLPKPGGAAAKDSAE